MELLSRGVFQVFIVVLLTCFTHGKPKKTLDAKAKVLRPFHTTESSDYRISTYEASVDEAMEDCKNLGGKDYRLLILENSDENKLIAEMLTRQEISSVWTAGKKTDNNEFGWSRSVNYADYTEMKYRDFYLNETILKRDFNPRRDRRSINNGPLAGGNLTATSKCRSRIPPECRNPPRCNVTLPECSITTPDCTPISEQVCEAVRPECNAKCESCTVSTPTCYAQAQNCTVKTPKNCRVEPKGCTIKTLPCTATRPDCEVIPVPCHNVTIPAPCTTREPCIRNNSCVGEDCKCPIAICQVNATICPQPETHCKPAIVTCPDPIVICNENPEVICDPPEVDCPEPTVICTEAQVTCSSPIVSCPAVVTTCLPPQVSCPPPELICPPPEVECETPPGDCELISTPEPCEDETTTTPPPPTTAPPPPPTTTTEKPCSGCCCHCMVMKKSNDYRWGLEKCRIKHRFICEAPK
ncbi:unnamed protein product [Orchesella dallaii]|uniref:C-type lectin domain-containing protein n=1 Tax=Orchesella dallaii TaxID=48710 RepID=A0ABP1RBX7_9HEXA